MELALGTHPAPCNASDAPYCAGCGYDLAGTRRERCPECGGRQWPLVWALEQREFRLKRVLKNATVFYVLGAPACLGFMAGFVSFWPAVLLLFVALFIIATNLSVLEASLLQRPRARQAVWRLWTVFGLQAAGAVMLVSATAFTWLSR